MSALGLMLTLSPAWQAVADFKSLVMEILSPSLGRRAATSLSAQMVSSRAAWSTEGDCGSVECACIWKSHCHLGCLGYSKEHGLLGRVPLEWPTPILSTCLPSSQLHCVCIPVRMYEAPLMQWVAFLEL